MDYYEAIMCVGHEDNNFSRARKLYRQRFLDERQILSRIVEQRRFPLYHVPVHVAVGAVT